MELRDHPERVEKFRRGDRETLAALYAAHVDAVEELLVRGFGFKSKGQAIRFRGLREPFEIQEVLQDAFMRAFRKQARDAYDPSKPWRPYLITITRNLVIDRFRRSTLEDSLFVKVGSLMLEDESEAQVLGRLSASKPAQVGDPGFSPELEAMRTQVSTVLASFVSTLDETDTRILQEHLMGSLSQNAMADELGMSRNDVRKQIREMRARLLRHLKAEGVIDTLDVEDVFAALIIVTLFL